MVVVAFVASQRASPIPSKPVGTNCSVDEDLLLLFVDCCLLFGIWCLLFFVVCLLFVVVVVCCYAVVCCCLLSWLLLLSFVVSSFAVCCSPVG